MMNLFNKITLFILCIAVFIISVLLLIILLQSSESIIAVLIKFADDLQIQWITIVISTSEKNNVSFYQ
ncbi:hypothetical protein Nwat_1014 [Nitrosococcus watsonii C-113]|uniref:Uncharacterized protein n=1 Tax=Nitrosococcus watsoni (strain C-113) TaxID=105559 RepID=D8K4X9_NITWC|nr:hypothetical protein Nwat_1014 [Nitrosococcus watsonii C-113]